ncbi:hypothetical protein C7999DRAFT_44529 [Corynascus novoguineensis]|uniref:Uncharacterized protein n=1 Tax=Corynascus novoguineensis TaxID=1126955 RepID=A0AAN7CLY3_9PEZI|nr:hypothetical protein C7999DRAFT_44529 [Corynascus novoguineensis]
MTHESFLVATVLEEDGTTARAILRGVTESHERHYFTRVQHYKPSDSTSRGLPTVKQLQKERGPTTAQWQELHQILVKQPSVVQVRTDITEEIENALSYHRAGATSDLIEESYCWWSQGIEYCLTRMFVVALEGDSISADQVPNPALLTPVGKIWILYVRAKVDYLPPTTMPERVKQAQVQLVRVREQLKGHFVFLGQHSSHFASLPKQPLVSNDRRPLIPIPGKRKGPASSRRCDEGRPTCKRCEKSRRECGGYRHEFELVHRDQTGSTVRRLRTVADPRRHKSTGPRPFVFIHEEPHSGRRRQSPSPPPQSALTIPLAHRASCYFASNFILVPAGIASHGFMEYLVPLMEAEPPESALRYAFNACAFALLGNRARADGVDLAQLSLKEHTLALAQTHKALGHPALANTDSTLAAILLLSLYEMCRTRIGTLLFTAVRHHLASRVVSSGMPVPFGTDWWMSGGDTESIFAKCQRFSLGFCDLRARAHQLLANASRSPEYLAQLHELAKDIQRQDRDVAEWIVSIPAQYQYRTAYWVPRDGGPTRGASSAGETEVFPGRVDVYPDYVTAMTWNIGRANRLLLASLNIRVAARIHAPADYRTTSEYATSKRICEDIIPDIIASVPYHLGWNVNGKRLGSRGLSAFACGEEGPCKALPALFLVWTLTSIKNHDFTTEEQRAWAKGRLKYIAEEVGLKYAHIVNDLNLRFPSMMIRQDGMYASVDPLKSLAQSTGLPPNFTAAAPTPESMTSVEQSPGRDSKADGTPSVETPGKVIG